MEKSKNLCFIFAVLSAIVLAFFIVAFHSVNVSAAENTETYTYTLNLSGKRTNSYGDYFTFTSTFECSYNYPVVGVVSSDATCFELYYYNGSSFKVARFTCASYSVIENTGVSNANSYYTVGNVYERAPLTRTYNQFSSHNVESYDNVSTTVPIFSSRDAALNYLQTGNDSEQVNKIDYDNLTDSKPLFTDFVDFDFNDTDTNYLRDFRLEGFKSDYFINASWTSVHIPDKLQQWIDKGTVDMDDVAVMVMFTYRNKSYPETESYVKYYPTLINANNLEATIKVSDFQPEFDTYYLADVSFIPVVEFTYYNSGMGTSMQPLHLMYYGSMNHVYFKYDGSVGGANFDSGDINGDKNGGFALGDDSYNGLGGITGDITDALAQFSSLLESLSGSLSRVAKFASVVFSWLPSWAYLLIGGAVAVCFLLRIAGR